jgi:outer membrane protein
MRPKLSSSLFLISAGIALAQTPQMTLQQAVDLALRNHPQVLAAQNEVNYSRQQITVNRSAYYPTITGEVTASQANNLARIGAGQLTAPRLFDRAGQGVLASQLITDFGRTGSLVASARLQAQSTEQNLAATRYNVILAVNRAYFGVLNAQAVVKVAEQTVSARQLLADQANQLAKSGLKSQLDVTFANTYVSEAKLLLLRARDAVASSLAELGRALGSDQPADFQLAEQPMPPGPSPKPDDLVAQAINNRPELAGLRFASQSAYKFYEAERDLSRPTVTAAAAAGFLPYINTTATSPIPAEYEGIGANVSIPVFNGHLFSARREAARQRAFEADQKLRDEQASVARDVRVVYASAIDAYQRIDVTAEFLRQAAMALDLAQGRYSNGLASIVELTQAQLNLTQAEIENLAAKYDYQTQYSALQYTIGALR